MSIGRQCDCLLCEIEARLLESLGHLSAPPGLVATGQLYLFGSARDLLAILRTPSAEAASEELLRGLLRPGATEPGFREGLLVLAFAPVLHRAVGQVARRQPALAQEDIIQQAFTVLLEVLRSDQLRTRRSHFAFAISRAVKRQLFAWAARESAKEAPLLRDSEVLSNLAEETFERRAQLGHFLARCAARGVLSASELNLLVQLKLGESRGGSSNAGRQRLKRVMAKLRRLAALGAENYFSSGATHFSAPPLNRGIEGSSGRRPPAAERREQVDMAGPERLLPAAKTAAQPKAAGSSLEFFERGVET